MDTPTANKRRSGFTNDWVRWARRVAMEMYVIQDRRLAARTLFSRLATQDVHKFRLNWKLVVLLVYFAAPYE